jgi:POT family proton-dependent oligopeptide transporter
MYLALVLLALGSGVIKPNISTLMGMTYDQQRPGQDRLRSQAFSWFYVAINVGSLTSYLVCPRLRDYFGRVDAAGTPADPAAGYLAAFLFPAALMAIALIVFAIGKRYYAVEPKPAAAATADAPAADRWAVVARLGGLFFLVMFFWAVFDQKATTWILFAREYIDLDVFGTRLAPDQLQSLNPLFIILFTPLVYRGYAALEARGVVIRPTTKMTIGFLLTAACMGLHAVAGYAAINPDGTVTRVPIYWQALAYLTLTLAEILISITGLELAYTAAPKSMTGFVTGLWLLTVGLANLIVAVPITRHYPGDSPAVKVFGKHLFDVRQFDSAGDYFAFLTVLMLAVTAAFVVVARRFNRAQEMQAKPAS